MITIYNPLDSLIRWSRDGLQEVWTMLLHLSLRAASGRRAPDRRISRHLNKEDHRQVLDLGFLRR